MNIILTFLLLVLGPLSIWSQQTNPGPIGTTTIAGLRILVSPTHPIHIESGDDLPIDITNVSNLNTNVYNSCHYRISTYIENTTGADITIKLACVWRTLSPPNEWWSIDDKPNDSSNGDDNFGQFNQTPNTNGNDITIPAHSIIPLEFYDPIVKLAVGRPLNVQFIGIRGAPGNYVYDPIEILGSGNNEILAGSILPSACSFFLRECIVATPNPTIVGGNLLVNTIVENASSSDVIADIYIRIRQQGSSGLIEQTIDAKPLQRYQSNEQAIFSSTIAATLDPRFNPGTAEVFVEYELTPGNPILVKEYLCENPTTINIESACAAGIVPEPVSPGTSSSSVIQQITTLTPTFLWKKICTPNNSVTGYEVEIRDYPNNNPITTFTTSSTVYQYLIAPSILRPSTTYTWTVTALSPSGNQTSIPFYFETPGPTNSNCNVDDILPSDTLLWNAVQYLCERQIVTPREWYRPSKTDVSPAEAIVREHLAWIVAAGLYGSKRAINNTYLYTQRYPIPFDDLVQAANNRDRYAKFLTYLDYNDQITPFDGDRHNFQPAEQIYIKFALKVLLEAFDIDVSNTSTPLTNVSLPFGQSDAMYKYVSTATRLGLLDHYPMGTSGDTPIKRGDAFIILYKIMTHPSLNRPSLIAFDIDTNFVESNFYKASNYAVRPSLADGNFSNYAKTSFVIPGTLMPLLFEHSYASSCLTLPKELFPMNPVGKSWSHNHHGYIIETTGSSKWGGIDEFGSGRFKAALAIFFPGSQHPHLFRRKTSGGLEAATDGLNYRITEDAVNNRITIETIERSRLVFEKLPMGTHMENVYMLKEVSEKNGNKLIYSYSNYVADTSHLTQVCAHYVDSLGLPVAPRCINLIYNSNHPDLLDRIEYPSPTGGAPREVFFDYDFTNKNLKSYKDALPVMTCSGTILPAEKYFYDTRAETPHLLNRIELPKGNYIDNTYHDRKLKSTTLSNSSGILTQTTINSQYDKFTGSSAQVVTSSEANGGGTVTSMTQKRNNAGYITETDYLRSDGAIDLFQIEYNNPQYPQNPTKVTAYGVVTNMAYNGNGQMTQREVISTLQNLTYIENWSYGSDSLLRTYTNRRRHSMTYDYDIRKNVISVTDFEGQDIRYEYYPNGLRKTITTPTQKVYRFTYDPYGNLMSSIGPTGITTKNTYDVVGRLTSTEDALGNLTTMEYLLNDLPSKVTRTLNGVPHAVEYCYDENYNNIWIEDEKGQRTNMKYTFAEDYLAEIEFGGNTRFFDYTDKGLLKEEETPNGHTKQYQYNIHNELLESDGYASYEYAPNDRDHLVKIRLLSNPNREYIEYFYDDFDRVSHYIYHTNGQGYRIDYTYDEESNVIGITYPSYGGNPRMTVHYTYNKNNQLETVNALGMTWQAYRRADGTIRKITYPNGMEKRYNYDNADRVDDLGYFKDASAPVPSNTLSRQQFTIDDRGFFTQELLTSPSKVALLPDLDLQFTQNAQNRVISKTDALIGQTATASFDPDGNQLSTDIGSTGIGTYTGMQWNNFEQLEIIENVSGTFRGEYTYGVLGQRNTAQRTRNGVSTTTNYFWEVSGTGNMLREERDSAGMITSLDYIYGFGEILARIPTDYTNSNLPFSAYRDTIRFFVSDMRGTVIGLLDYDQNFTEQYEVTSYGEMISHEIIAGEVPNYFIFVGAYGVEWEDTSLYKMGVRYYDVEQVCFLSEDPIWNTNLHGYAGGNTVMAIDPEGLSWSWLDNPYIKAELQAEQQNIDNHVNRVNDAIDDVTQTVSDVGEFTYENFPAVLHYYIGFGSEFTLPDVVVDDLLNHPDFLKEHNNILSGNYTSNIGNFGVNLKEEHYHIGRTRVDYVIGCYSQYCSVTYTLFSGDGFWDPVFGDWDGSGWKGEIGIPYPYAKVYKTYRFKPFSKIPN